MTTTTDNENLKAPEAPVEAPEAATAQEAVALALEHEVSRAAVGNDDGRPQSLHLPAQPDAPLQVTWADTADHYWASIDDTALQGWQPLPTNQAINPARNTGALMREVNLALHEASTTDALTGIDPGPVGDPVPVPRGGHVGLLRPRRPASVPASPR